MILLRFPACLYQESTVFGISFWPFLNTRAPVAGINRGEASVFSTKNDGGKISSSKNHGKFSLKRKKRHHETPWIFLVHATLTPKRCNLRQASEVATRHIHIWSLIDMPQGGSRHLYPQPIPKSRGRFLDFQKLGGWKKVLPNGGAKMINPWWNQ